MMEHKAMDQPMSGKAKKNNTIFVIYLPWTYIMDFFSIYKTISITVPTFHR